MNKIVVATQNRAKLEATQAALNDMGYPDESYPLWPVSVESGVSDTPLGDEEGIRGCENRIEAVRGESPDAELYIALEGVLAQVGSNWFVRGWTMIHDQERSRRVTASGAAVQIPSAVTSSISSIEQFSQTVKEIYAVTPEESQEIRNVGANGVFSNGIYTRFNTFYDGVRICVAQLTNERNW